MRFSDCGIIIGIKNYSETSAIVKIFSQHHGIYSAFTKSIKSSRSRAIYQIGNLVSFEFRCRIEENLGSFFAVDLVKSYCAKIIFEPLKLNCVSSLFLMIDELFLERENQQALFEKLQLFLQKISDEEISKKVFLADYIKLELKILETLGYGIDLSSCAVTDSTANLVFVSPKSARAVSYEAGKTYQDKLLKLPSFLIKDVTEIGENHLFDGLALSGFFLQKFFFSEKKSQDLFHRNSIKKSLEALEK